MALSDYSDYVDSLFFYFPCSRNFWKWAREKLIDHKVTQKLAENDFENKIKNCGNLGELQNFQKTVELRYDYKKEMLSIGVLLISIGITSGIAGLTLSSQSTPIPITFVIYPNQIWFIVGVLFFLLGIYFYYISYKNFQICQKILETSERRIIELTPKFDDEK